MVAPRTTAPMATTASKAPERAMAFEVMGSSKAPSRNCGDSAPSYSNLLSMSCIDAMGWVCGSKGGWSSDRARKTGLKDEKGRRTVVQPPLLAPSPAFSATNEQQ